MNLKVVWRRLPIVTFLAAGVVLLAGAGQANAQAVITGRVVDADGAPVAFAEIAIERINVGTVADVDGSYRLLVPAARVSGASDHEIRRPACMVGSPRRSSASRPGRSTSSARSG